MTTEDDMIQPDPELGELIIAAARIRLGEQSAGIPAPAFKFPTTEQEITAVRIVAEVASS